MDGSRPRVISASATAAGIDQPPCPRLSYPMMSTRQLSRCTAPAPQRGSGGGDRADRDFVFNWMNRGGAATFSATGPALRPQGLFRSPCPRSSWFRRASSRTWLDPLKKLAGRSCREIARPITLRGLRTKSQGSLALLSSQALMPETRPSRYDPDQPTLAGPSQPVWLCDVAWSERIGVRVRTRLGGRTTTTGEQDQPTNARSRASIAPPKLRASTET